jgi:tetratricopeptide (TPR) repeat protein
LRTAEGSGEISDFVVEGDLMTDIENSEEFRQRLNDSARLLRQNRPGEALAALESLYKQAPTQPDLAINVGGAYILQRKWNRAVAVLSRAVEANPENVMLWMNLAAAQLGNLATAGPKQQDRAIAAYERVLALDPEAPNVHYHLGLIYKERGELNRAGAFFQRALEVQPGDKDARYWLEQIAKLPAPRDQQAPKPPDDAPGTEAGNGEMP